MSKPRRPLIRRRTVRVTSTGEIRVEPELGPEIEPTASPEEPAPRDDPEHDRSARVGDSAAELPILRREPSEDERHEELEGTQGRGIGTPSSGWIAALLLLFVALPAGLAVGWWTRPAPAKPEVSAEWVDFGEVEVSRTVEREVSLRNVGEAEMAVLQVDLEMTEGSASDDWVLEPGTCFRARLEREQSCTARVRYAPSADGPSTAILRFATDADRATEVPMVVGVVLAGKGASSVLELEPAEIAFGSARVGERGPVRTLTLRNGGTRPLSVEGLWFDGLAAADFVRVGGGSGCEGELASGASCSVSFEFIPTAEGERRAALQVRSDATRRAPAPELVGVGATPRPGLEVSHQRIDFGKVRLGERSTEAILEVTSGGDAPLRLLDVALQSTDTVEAFRVEADECAGRDLAPGARCRIRLRFRPQREGEAWTVLEMRHEGGAAPTLVPVAGIGIVPKLRLGAQSVVLGEVAVGTRSPWQALEIENRGSAPLHVLDLALEGADRRFFEVAADGCRGPVPPGQACQAQLRFVPRRAGPHRVELAIRHDAAGGVVRTPVLGLGLSARLEVDPERLDFGTVAASQALRLRLRNTGRALVRIERIYVEGSMADEFEVAGDCDGAIERGGSCWLVVRFAPSTQGIRRAELVLEHDAGHEPLRVPLEATGLPGG